jgi:hypothetical protein
MTNFWEADVTSQRPDIQPVLERLEKLEQECKRSRMLGALLLLLLAAILLAGAAQPGQHTLTANEFILQDNQGRTRADLSVDSKGVAFTFFDEAERKQMLLMAGRDTTGHGHAWLALGERAANARLTLVGTDPDDFATVSDGGVFVAGKHTTRIVLSVSGPDSPSVEVADSQGYTAALGVSRFEQTGTGETHETSAASLVLLGKDGKAIWRAP